MTLKIIEMSLIFMVFFGLLYYLLRQFRGRILTKNGLLEMVHYHPFGPKKGIAVVKLMSEYYVLGVTEENISLITKLTGDEIEKSVQTLKAPRGVKNGKKMLKFKSLLRISAVVVTSAILVPEFAFAAAKQGLLGGGIFGFTSPMELLLFFTLLSLLPAILVMCTSFTRVVVVFSFLRQALGTPQVPPTQVIIGLSLFITFFIMSPVVGRIYTDAYVPMKSKEISAEDALEMAGNPLKEFMLRQADEKDIALFLRMAKLKKPKRPMDLQMRVVIPAFAVGELKKAFQIGFLLFLPFVVIDMMVASILLSLGMMMLPPAMISMPFKLLLFVLVNGWDLIVLSVIRGFM